MACLWYTNRTDVQVTIDVFVPTVNATNGVFVAARINSGGCHSLLADGIFFYILPSVNQIIISTDLGIYCHNDYYILLICDTACP